MRAICATGPPKARRPKRVKKNQKREGRERRGTLELSSISSEGGGVSSSPVAAAVSSQWLFCFSGVSPACFWASRSLPFFPAAASLATVEVDETIFESDILGRVTIQGNAAGWWWL